MKARLVKAASPEAARNQRQAERINQEALTLELPRYKKARRKFNPLVETKAGVHKDLRAQVKANFTAEANRPRKAVAKVPKQGNHGFKRGERPYQGPGKPKGPAAASRPALIFVEPEGSYDKTKFNKPNHPESRAFRSWRSGPVIRRR
jgi:hypothetical protein